MGHDTADHQTRITARPGTRSYSPAAILQPPFFDFTVDDAINYGAIGSIIGHEFSHGFDDQGRKFDGSGRLADWWTEADAERYEARSAGTRREQYDAFRPLPEQSVKRRADARRKHRRSCRPDRCLSRLGIAV